MSADRSILTNFQIFLMLFLGTQPIASDKAMRMSDFFYSDSSGTTNLRVYISSGKRKSTDSLHQFFLFLNGMFHPWGREVFSCSC